MGTEKILLTGPIADVATRILEEFGEIVIAPDFTEDTLVDLVEDAMALVVRGEGIASARVINAGGKLRVIGRSGVGYNNIDIAAATARRIPVVFTPGAGARAVAEGAMSLMLALCKDLTYWDQQLKAGNWQSRFETRTRDLDGATVGVVGFGRIGQVLAAMLKPFQCTIVAHDPYVEASVAAELETELVSLEHLFERADFISVHAIVTDETRGLIDRQMLSRLKRGCYFVNMARGELVESHDVLEEAMADGRLAGVGLDVFSPEPPDVTHPIFKRANCLTSPHALGVTFRSSENIFGSMARDMAAIFRGEQPQFLVNPEVMSKA
jgi:D-3-phosphoglycerate dehydrogenase